jgi:hypothetical protein
MSPRSDRKRQTKSSKPEPAPSPFAPAAFLKGSPEAVRELCEGLAGIAHQRFSDLTGTTWQRAGSDLARQLRAAGHDLTSFDESDELQEWQATFYHPRGTFSLSLTFRAPTSVEVTWRTDDATITARRP